MNTLPTTRPTAHSEAVIKVGLDAFFPVFLQWYKDSDEDIEDMDEQDIKNDLFKVLKRSSYQDGYQLAKDIESVFYCDGDSELVEIMDSVNHYLYKAEDEAIKQWVKDNGIIPQHKVGDTVNVKLLKGEFQGNIINVDVEKAKYSINIEALGHVPHHFIDDNGSKVAVRTNEKQSGTLGTVLPCEQVDD